MERTKNEIHSLAIISDRHCDRWTFENTGGHTLNLLRRVLLSWKSSFQRDWYSWIIVREGSAFVSFSLSFPPWSSLNIASVSSFSFSCRSFHRDEERKYWHETKETRYSLKKKKKQIEKTLVFYLWWGFAHFQPCPNVPPSFEHHLRSHSHMLRDLFAFRCSSRRDGISSWTWYQYKEWRINLFVLMQSLMRSRVQFWLPVDCCGVVVPHFLLLSIVTDTWRSKTSVWVHSGVYVAIEDGLWAIQIVLFILSFIILKWYFVITHSDVILTAIAPDVIRHLKPKAIIFFFKKRKIVKIKNSASRNFK